MQNPEERTGFDPTHQVTRLQGDAGNSPIFSLLSCHVHRKTPEKLTLLARVFLKPPRSGRRSVEAGAAVRRSVEGGSRRLP